MNLKVIPKLADLAADPDKSGLLPPEAIPALLGELERLKATLWVRLTLVQSSGAGERPAGAPEERRGGAAAEPEDRWLTAEQAAPLLGVTSRWLYRHKKKLPFARQISRKVLRFSESGLRKWQAAKKA